MRASVSGNSAHAARRCWINRSKTGSVLFTVMLPPDPRGDLTLAAFCARFGFLILGRLDFIEILFGVVAAANPLVSGAEARFAGGLGAGAEQQHVFIACVIELIELPRRNGHQH